MLAICTQFLLLAIACDPVSEAGEQSPKLPVFRCVAHETRLGLCSIRSHMRSFARFSRWWSLQLLRRIGKATGVQTKKHRTAQKERVKRL